MWNKLFIILLDYLYISLFFFLDPLTWPIFYLGFLYLVKVNAITFNYLPNLDLNLNLISLIPWSFIYFLVSWPLLNLDGLSFILWFNVWSVFMFSIGYGGYLILFKLMNLTNTINYLWDGFRVHFRLNQILKILIFANILFYLKLLLVDFIPVIVLNLVILMSLFGVSKFVKSRFLV